MKNIVKKVALINNEKCLKSIIRVVASALILFSIITVYVTTPKETEFARFADEGYYFKYAKAVKDYGVGQFPLLLKRHLADKKPNPYPHPGRIGHTLITSLWLRIFPDTFRSLARLSFVCFVLFLLCSFHFSKKFWGHNVAYLYTVLLSCSPLIMTSGRRVLQESILNLFWAITLWSFLDFLTKKKLSKFILFLAVYSFSITIKETSITLLPFFALSFLVCKYAYKQPFSYWYLAVLLTIPFILTGFAYIIFMGGLANILSLLKYLLALNLSEANIYSLYTRGPWYRYIIDFLMLSPLTTLLAIGYLFYILASRRFVQKTVYWGLYLVVVFAVFSSMKYAKVVRYVMNLDIAIYLFTVWALFELFRQKNRVYQGYLVLAAVVLIYCNNYFNFLYLFVIQRLYDPISYWLLILQKIIPPL